MRENPKTVQVLHFPPAINSNPRHHSSKYLTFYISKYQLKCCFIFIPLQSGIHLDLIGLLGIYLNLLPNRTKQERKDARAKGVVILNPGYRGGRFSSLACNFLLSFRGGTKLS